MQVDMQSNDLVTPPRTNGKALMYNVSNTEATVPTARTDIEETFFNKNTLPYVTRNGRRPAWHDEESRGIA